MSTARLRERTPSCTPLGTAILSGYALRFHKLSKDKSAKCDAFETGDDADEVVGVLYSIATAERAALDTAEGLNKGYAEAIVTVVNEEGRRRKVLIYLATPDAIVEGLKPYTWYKDFVLAGAREHGVPEEYIEQAILPVEAVPDPKLEREKKERAVAR